MTMVIYMQLNTHVTAWAGSDWVDGFEGRHRTQYSMKMKMKKAHLVMKKALALACLGSVAVALVPSSRALTQQSRIFHRVTPRRSITATRSSLVMSSHRVVIS